MLNILQYTSQPSTTKNHLALSINSAVVEKSCSSVLVSLEVTDNPGCPNEMVSRVRYLLKGIL